MGETTLVDPFIDDDAARSSAASFFPSSECPTGLNWVGDAHGEGALKCYSSESTLTRQGDGSCLSNTGERGSRTSAIPNTDVLSDPPPQCQAETGVCLAASWPESRLVVATRPRPPHVASPTRLPPVVFDRPEAARNPLLSILPFFRQLPPPKRRVVWVWICVS